MLRFFGRRKGKSIGASRERLMDNLLPKVKLVVPKKGKINMTKIFPFKPKEIWLEIGFGGGEHVAELAKINKKEKALRLEEANLVEIPADEAQPQ